MGGNFWKLGRMPRVQYLQVELDVRHYLDTRAPGEYRIPAYFADKADFGDLDVLLSSDVLRRAPKFLETLYEDLGITQVGKINGHTRSAIFQGLQVDFFICPPNKLESSWAFMSWGEVGNILGRMVRRLHLKFGVNGLTYVYRWSDHYKRELSITRDFQRVCDLLELDYNLWEAGFNCREDMFSWVVASPYFSPRPYLDPKGPMADRASVRPGILAFIDWVKAHDLADGRHIDDPEAVVEAAFPNVGLQAWLRKEEKFTARLDALSRAFNGRLVMSLRPGLAGKPLGEFLRQFRASRPNFEDWVLEATHEEISQAIQAFTVVAP